MECSRLYAALADGCGSTHGVRSCRRLGFISVGECGAKLRPSDYQRLAATTAELNQPSTVQRIKMRVTKCDTDQAWFLQPSQQKKLCVSASLREALNPFLAQSRRGAEKNLVIGIDFCVSLSVCVLHLASLKGYRNLAQWLPTKGGYLGFRYEQWAMLKVLWPGDAVS